MVTTTSPQPDATLTGGRRRGPDRLFRGLAVSASGIVVALVVIVGAFLVTKAAPSLAADTASFLGSREWDVADPTNLRFGIAQLLWVTVISSILAMALAVPVAIGVALYLTHYAPARVAKPFAYLVDLLAAVPSIVFGLWGARVLMHYVQPFQDFLKGAFGWFPLFAPTSVQAGTIFLASIVLAITSRSSSMSPTLFCVQPRQINPPVFDPRVGDHGCLAYRRWCGKRKNENRQMCSDRLAQFDGELQIGQR